MISTGTGGAGVHGGIGGRGGNVHLHSHNYAQESSGPLMSLPRANYARHDSGRENPPSACLEGTRVAILEDIMSWSESTNGERPPVYWLSGLAGIGKSTIANTVAQRAQEKAMLGATFFFSRSDKPLRDPQLVFPTLAFQLAQSDSTFKNVIMEALGQDPTLGHKQLLPQLQGLILTPLLKINPCPHPILIILDALDECDEKGAADILRLVFSHVIQIPFLRILIASRPQPHLSSVFNKVANLAKTVLHDIEASIVQEDIRTYISFELAKIPENLNLSMPDDWVPEAQKNLLVEKSGRLFVYAATAIRFIGDDRVRDPPAHLRLILNTRSAQEEGAAPYSQLDELYTGVLRTSLSVANQTQILKRFQIVVGSIVILREPLPLDSLARFVKFERDIAEATLYHLHSVIIPPSSAHEAPRIYHPSFLEFITDASRCSLTGFVIVPKPEQELRHAIRCFELMRAHLKRDVASISDPSLLNTEVDGFEEKVRSALPLEVQYACRYWASHLSGVELGEKRMVDALEVFSRRSILWWLEAMSLIGSISSAASLIQEACRWATQSKCNSTLVTMLSDGYRFILAHWEVMGASALHVYYSAMPFTPPGSALYKAYREDEMHCIRVLQGVESEWSQALAILRGHSYAVTSIAFSPDGLHLASGSYDAAIFLWDAKSAAPIAELEGHLDWITTIVFSPDGFRLASGSYDCTLWLWDAVSGMQIAKLEGHSGPVMSIAFSPDGLFLASGSHDHTIWLWDAVSGVPITKLAGHSDSVMSVAFSPDGLHLTSGSSDSTLQLWDAVSGAPIAQLKGHTDGVRTVAFSPNGLSLASGSQDHTLWLWDAMSGMPISKLEGHSGWVTTVAFSPNGLCLASGSHDHTLYLWDVMSGMAVTHLEGHWGPVRTIAFSPDGLHLASGSDDFTICLWDVTSGTCIDQIGGHSGPVTGVAFSPDGLHLASGSHDQTLHLWDATSGVPYVKQDWHFNPIRSIVFSPDGLHLASASFDRTLQLWDAVSGAPILNSRPVSHSARLPAFSPDGLHLASGTPGHTMSLWDSMSGALITVLKGHTGEVLAVAFSPDGLCLASGSEDCTLRLWDGMSGAPIAKLEGSSGSIVTIAFSPDGLHLASGSDNHTLQLWDVVSGVPMAKLEGHTAWITTVAFSPDGLTLASASHDQTLQLWDTISGMLIAKLENCPNPVTSIIFSSSGSTLLACMWQHTLEWDLTSQNPEYVSQYVFSGTSAVAPMPISGLTPLIWSLCDRWIQVEQWEGDGIRRICCIPAHDTFCSKIAAAKVGAEFRIAIGYEDDRLIIIAVPFDPFDSHLT